MNCVDIIGMLRGVIDEHSRYFEYELPFDQPNNDVHPIIVVKYWTRQPNNRLITLAPNTRVAIHGHLDVDKKFGTILLVEQLEVLR